MVQQLILTISLLLHSIITPVWAAEISGPTLFELTNQARLTQSIAELRYSEILEQAALAKAEDMLTKGYFDHFGPAGETPWQFLDQAGYQYRYGGENLAVGFSGANEVVDAWLSSPTHRQNLLENQFTDIGIAVVPAWFDGLPDLIIVQMFGSLSDYEGNDELTSYVNTLLGVGNGA